VINEAAEICSARLHHRPQRSRPRSSKCQDKQPAPRHQSTDWDLHSMSSYPTENSETSLSTARAHHSESNSVLESTEREFPEHGSQPDVLVLIEQSRSRGTGNHICPYGQNCSKGGVEANGRPRIFTRNCEWRYVLLNEGVQ
jgi:hypothetical protein